MNYDKHTLFHIEAVKQKKLCAIETIYIRAMYWKWLMSAQFLGGTWLIEINEYIEI